MARVKEEWLERQILIHDKHKEENPCPCGYCTGERENINVKL